MMRFKPNRLAAAPLAAALALAACHPSSQEDAAANDEVQALPPLAEGAATWPARAPAASALPAVRPLAYSYAEAPGEGDYGWIDQADLLLDTIGDAPPDYAFDYEGVEPWAWQTADDYEIFAEPIDSGWRYYYYAPNAFEPFLVRDPYYSYGYRNGRVAAVYGADGRYVDRAAALRQAEAASRYYARARSLRTAARNGDRLAIASARWADQRQTVSAARRQWDQAREQESGWRRQRAERQASIVQRAGERAARAGAAQRFATWQQARFRGPPPRLYGARPDQPAAQVLARREAAVHQADVRRQARARAQGEAGRPAAIAPDHARNGDVRAQQQAEPMGAREAQARQRAAGARAGRAPAGEAVARQRAQTGTNARQPEQAQVRPRARPPRAQAPQRAEDAHRRAERAQAQARRQAARPEQHAVQAPRQRAAPSAPAHHAVQVRQHAPQAPHMAQAPTTQAPPRPQARAGPRPAAAAAPAVRRPDREGHGRKH